MKLKLKSGEITVGQALPWAAYDPSGLLLLRKGSIIQNLRQLESLLERGLYRRDTEATEATSGSVPLKDESTPFHILDDLSARLTKCFELVNDAEGEIRDSPHSFTDKIAKIGLSIQKVCDSDPDAALGSVHLQRHAAYVIHHPLHCAILAYLVAKRLKVPAERHPSIIAAALTQNISTLKLQQLLTTQRVPLTESQRQKIDTHSQDTMKMLLNVGVRDSLWLDIILKHHECLDGSGYPGHLQRGAIGIEVQIVGMADRYGAKIAGRAYRHSISAKDALREFFISKRHIYDEVLILAFIKELGVYPPGSFVLLNNGEVAVVIERQTDTVWPTVASIVSPRGGPYNQPLRRQIDGEQFAIKDQHQFDFKIPLNLHMIWGYL